MRNFLSRLVNSVKKHKILSAMIVIIVALFAWWAFVNLTPKPLGDKMEYLGKEDYGCWVGFCDARPYSVYYYGTDLSEEEVVGYFKGAQLKRPIEDKGTYSEIWLTYSGHTSLVEYFDQKENSSLNSTEKKSIISISSHYYHQLKNTVSQ